MYIVKWRQGMYIVNTKSIKHVILQTIIVKYLTHDTKNLL